MAPTPRPARSATSVRHALPALLLAGLAACGGGGDNVSGTESPPPRSGYVDGNTYSAMRGSSLSTPNEATSATHHTLTVDGTAYAYTATAGHLTAKDLGSGAAEASFFYVAYTVDGAPAATRPVTFFFNGGPGSSTVWLHLGSWAPKRLVTGAPATTQTAPFPYVDNPDSLIDTSDLVFVDAVGTGLSEAIAPNTNQTYWGVDADAQVFRDFVIRWLAANGRTASPLFVYGESYGTVRAPLLARYLETAGTPVKGVVLQSSVLDYNSSCEMTVDFLGHPTVDCSGLLPTYGAVGAFWNKVTPAPADLESFLAGLRSYADDVYGPQVAQWLAAGGTGGPPAGADVATLQADTGLPASYWTSEFDVDYDVYRHNLIPGQVLGVYDGRMAAASGSALAAGDDPSSTFIAQPFEQAITSVLAGDLAFTNPTTYVEESDAIDYWNFSHAGRSLPDVVPDLAAAIALDPNLKVLSIGGEHDLITPFHQTERDLARLAAGAPVTSHFYAGGHMVYLNDPSRAAMKADLKAFYAAAAGAK
jgi:carboxypeptidase C (cathepsin A)